MVRRARQVTVERSSLIKVGGSSPRWEIFLLFLEDDSDARNELRRVETTNYMTTNK